MIYNIEKDNYCKFETFGINKMPPRAYFIPFSNLNTLKRFDYLKERYNSDRVIMLSGEWDFKYYDKFSKLPKQFDAEKESFDKIKVPSTWQRTGYENPCYLNTRYQFPLKPPTIPTDIPVGVYRKNVNIKSLNDDFILTFLGACSTIELYINGKFVGYSEGSHDTAEFDIKNYLVEGANEILVLNHKWSNGTYLECQDMFRENGIFRDVYITVTKKAKIKDFYLDTAKVDNLYRIDGEIFGENLNENNEINIKIVDNKNSLLCETTLKNIDNKFSFDSLDVKEWSAETPNLYTAYITLTESGKEIEAIRHYIGFKKVLIKGEIFYFNDKKIKFNGVNHHDSTPDKGFVMTAEEYLNDAKIIKEFNCNSIRMAHYPPDPVFLTICDVIGFYVIDEMDIECHGVYQNPLSRRYGLISHDIKWKNHFLARAKAMYFRDRNHASVTMWSLGNEAGGDKNQTACYEFFKANSKIPVHYENVIHTKKHSYDVISEMYTPSAKLEQIGKHAFNPKYTGKPFFMCEFAHAMGVGPGALSEYVKIYYKYENLMGGCIWEFCDHAVLHKDGKYKYTYGGDHKEEKHDGNFCVDGLFRPDRTPSSGAINMREVFRPLRAKLLKDDIIEIENVNRFLSSDYIKIRWELLKNGEVIESGEILNIIKPESTEIVQLNFDYDRENDYHLNLIYNKKIDNSYIAKEQLNLNNVQYKIYEEKKEDLKVEEKGENLIVTVDNGQITFNTKSYNLTSYKSKGVEFINQKPIEEKGFVPNIMRATLDNDRFIKIFWKIIGYYDYKVVGKKLKLNSEQKAISIKCYYKLKKGISVARVSVEYRIVSSGLVMVIAKISNSLRTLFYGSVPRFGLQLEMPKSFNNIRYYGRGESENLCDFNEHAYLGIYNSKVKDLQEYYIKPQENGMHTAVRYIEVTNENKQGLKFIHIDNYLTFSARNITSKQLEKCGHHEDIKEYDSTVLNIDGFMRGTGSQSCGQGPLPQYKYSINKNGGLEFRFAFYPIF